MVLKLYGSAMSTARVLVVILEKQLPYELIPLDISKGEHKQEPYASLHPFGRVPVLEDNGLFVYESRAICKYLARAYKSGTKLMPDDDDYRAYALFEQACSVEQSYFASATETLATELFIKVKKGLGPPDQARIAQAEADFDHCLAVYNQILGKQKYLAGDELTLVDLFHLPNGSAFRAGGWKHLFEKYPNVDRWLSELTSRETWKEASKTMAYK